MILKSTISISIPPLPPSKSFNFPSGYCSFTHYNPKNHSIISQFSKLYNNNNNNVNYDKGKKPVLKWTSIYKKVSLMEKGNPEMGVANVLNKCEKEGKRFSKWELCRIVRELRKFGNFELALQVYEWMNNRIERFRLSSSDTAIQLDLIAKVRGVLSAEDYFARLPDTVRDKRIYGALLNAYVGAKERDKAESLLEEMRNKAYATHALPFNVMMTLYMKLNEYDKVENLISEMKQKKIRLDLYSYNIWLSAHGSQESAEGMEAIFEEMKMEPTVMPNWTTYSTLAAVYIKLGLLEKAEQCLKDLETRLTGRDKMPYHYLISLYGNLGNKEEVYRVWNTYKSSFASIPNWGCHAVLASLIRLGDIEGAEKIFEEWLPVKTSYDPRVANLLMGWYVREEPFEKVKSFFDKMVQGGGKPNSGSWEILGEAHVKEGRISEALKCYKEAMLAEGPRSWKPKPSNISAFLELCDQESDPTSKEDFVMLLNQFGCFKNESYRSLLVGHGVEIGEGEGQLPFENDGTEETEHEESDLLLAIAE